MANVYEAHHSNGQRYTVTTDHHHDDHGDQTFKQILTDIIKGSISGVVSGTVVHFVLKKRG